MTVGGSGGRPRVAVLGLCLEVNGFAPPSGAEEFHGRIHHGDAALRYLAAMGVAVDRPDWRPLPITIAVGQSGGPLDATFYLRLRDDMMRALKALPSVDGVFVYGHGAGATTTDDDLDGDFLAAVRCCVGPATPVAVELDLHANPSDRFWRAADIVIGYHTNPHVDQGVQANRCIDALLATIRGRRMRTVSRRLPLITTPVTLLTKAGSPMDRCRADAVSVAGRGAFDVSLFPGFAYGDCPHAGFTVALTTADGQHSAGQLCDRIAEMIWARRDEFVARTWSIARAVALRTSPERRSTPTIFADVADNPGGGGRSNTIHLLRALAEVDGPSLLAGAFFDPALVRQAAEAGAGAEFHAVFNRDETSALSGTWQCRVTVKKVAQCAGPYRRGIHAGNRFDFGVCAHLAAGSCDVFVTSRRHQLLSPEPLAELGIAPSAYRQLMIKSRGHFRAGFAGFAAEDDIFEVDGPGLTTVDLSAIPWRRLRRPVHPIDRLSDPKIT